MNVQAILIKIAATATRDELIFPTTTEIELKVRRLLDDPNCSIEQLARLVQADPLLATRVVAVANSVIYNRTGQSITDVISAISRIGQSTLHVMATAVVVRQMEEMAQTIAHRQMAFSLWGHTAHVAALA